MINAPDVEEMTTALNKLGELARLYEKEFNDLDIMTWIDDCLLRGQAELEKYE
jgi:hypothetical protein